MFRHYSYPFVDISFVFASGFSVNGAQMRLNVTILLGLSDPGEIRTDQKCALLFFENKFENSFGKHLEYKSSAFKILQNARNTSEL